MRILSFLLALLLGSQAASVGAREGRPNVVLIYTDDQGSVDLQSYGSTDLVTPHMDSLAKRGVRFTQFYSASPVCSPSRAAVLTGRVPQRAGVPNNAGSTRGRAGMPAEQLTMAEMFRAAGYATAHVGKWHLGYTPETMPNGQGFDHSFGHMGGCIDNYSHFFYWQGPNRHDLHRNGREVFANGRYFPDLMVEEASKFIREHRERPFFMYFAFNTPHYPYQGEPKWLEHYASLPHPRNLYAAFLSSQDERVGQLLALLEELELRDDTIIILQSDHGHSTEERAWFGGGSAGPYRGAKFSLFEGGIRVPAIISWPGQLPEGAVREQLATSCDWLPTLAELCGIEAPKRRLDGRSIAALIRSEDAASPHENFHWALGKQWAVREGRWKLLANPRDTSVGGKHRNLRGQVLLFDLEASVTETENLAAERPEIVQRLTRLHEAWWSEVQAQ